jgi:hypothetical protein
MFYSFKLLSYNIIKFKKISLKMHVWLFCMGSLGPMIYMTYYNIIVGIFQYYIQYMYGMYTTYT